MTTPPIKPQKPYPDFPLFAHASGQWAKKIRGKLFYFGVHADPDAALNKYLNERDDRQAGSTPRVEGNDLTVRELCNQFLNSKRLLLEAGELAPVTWRNYHDVCDRVVDFFGKTRPVLALESIDFEKLRSKFAKTRGAQALASQVQKVRTLFKFAYDANLIERPVRFGPVFRKPSKSVMRRARHAAGSKMLTPDEVRALMQAASQPLRAMILLGLNCGFGQTDCANLPASAIDFKGQWVNFPRPKTAIARRCPLWPETIAAIREAITERPFPKSVTDEGLAFITKYGHRWVRTRDREKTAM